MENFTHLKRKINEEYWLKKLTSNLSRATLPTNRSMSKTLEKNREILEMSIPKEIENVLNQMSKGSDLARLILFFTTVTSLLYRYSSGGGILLGTTTLRGSGDSRTSGDLLFIKSNINGGMTWKELNEEMVREMSQTFNHSGISEHANLFQRIKGISRENSKEIWQIACIDEDLQVDVKELECFNLVIKLAMDESGLKLKVDYNATVYSGILVNSFIENLVYNLASLKKNMLFKLDDEELDILAPKQREFLTLELNDTEADLLSYPLLHQLFEEQVNKTPDSIAVVNERFRISYSDLNGRANQLARTLRKSGIGNESVVGIVGQPTIDAIVSILAVLKAGGSYCPIDPNAPIERINHIMNESGISLLLVQDDDSSIAVSNVHVLNTSNPELFRGDDTNLNYEVQPSNLAYVIYTSGSTGTPKGVMIEHRNIVNQIAGLKTQYAFNEKMNYVLMAPLTFDPSVQQIFLPLSTGGTLHLVPNEVKTSPNYFWSYVNGEKINVINTVPSLMEVLLEQCEEVGHVIEFLILAGELFTGDLSKRLREKIDIKKLINIYGPTEASINTTWYECKSDEESAVIPIGKPLSNYQVYILNKNRCLVPYGVTGELYISGKGLARGYINNVEMTNEMFVPNSHSETEERMYKTGDLVKWLPDGNLEFVGRKDQQVKIRGMRVELGEIETVFLKNPFIKEACVINHGFATSNELIAFYTLNNSKVENNNVLENDTLKDYLKQYLPNYMIPTHCIRLESMPVTDNGKINKKALPIDQIGSASGRVYIAPRNESEEKLNDIWKELLGVREIGIYDSFFEVGGNSLSVIRLQNRINKKFKLNLTVPQLFTYHTISMQASFINGEEDEVTEFSCISDESSVRNVNTIGRDDGDCDIAVIGMSCRFPLANGYNDFWNNLSQDVDAIRSTPTSRIRDIIRKEETSTDREILTPQAAYLESIDGFDPEFFGISPNEAKIMDPQQRLFLKVAHEAILDAGYSNKDLYGSKTGVYVGAGKSSYSDLIHQGDPSAIPGNLQSAISGRISYVFNLTGPSEVIDTACSSSLMSIHHAVQGIVTNECDMAIAGGVNLYMSEIDQTIYDMGIASPDGKAKSFDASADGTGGGEGVGAVLLKSLKKAVADGDHIYAVIKGSAANSDGRSNGITAPNAASQSNVIREAWKRAGINPETVTYIEAHGTGTKLGDPIEIEGITNAFRSYTNRKQFCAVGSVKTNIGHLDSAAGIAGFIKTVLAISNKKIPASLHFQQPNAHIDFVNSPIYVNGTLDDWQPECGIRRAGVSSFGLSGTNCHVVLEEYPEKDNKSSKTKSGYLFTLSANSKEALINYARRFSKYLLDANDDLADICYCSSISRSDSVCRLAIRTSSLTDLRIKLNNFLKISESSNQISQLEKYQVYTNIDNDLDSIKVITPIDRMIEPYLSGKSPDWYSYYKGQGRRRVSLPAYPYEEKRYWIEENLDDKNSTSVVPMPITNEEKNFNFLDIPQSVFSLGEQLLDKVGFSEDIGYKEAVDEFSAQLILGFFQHFETLIDSNMAYTIQELLDLIGVSSQYNRLCQFMLRSLEKMDYIQVTGNLISLNKNTVTKDIEFLLNQYCNKYPNFSGTFKILKYCFEFYPEVLTGKKSPLSVLFPDGTSRLLATFTNKGKTWGDMYETMAIDSIKQYINSKQQQGKKLKILELGAGSGTIGKVLFPAINNEGIEYYYTDLSRAILMEAQKQFKEFTFVNYKLFNIENNPIDQGFMSGEFDIIIGLNVIHATRSLRPALSNLKKILSPNGTIFVIEKVQNEIAENLVWGMTEGWWLYEDVELRMESPLISINEWEMLLKEEISDEVYSFPVDINKRSLAETAMIVARMSSKSENISDSSEGLLYGVNWIKKDIGFRESVTSKGNWLILKDPLGIGDRLNQLLEAAGYGVVSIDVGDGYRVLDNKHYQINPGNADHYKFILRDLQSKNIQFKGILHLWTCTEVTDELKNEGLEKTLITGVQSLFHLTKAMLEHGINKSTEIRVVSNHAHQISNDKIVSPEKSPIFGLVKVISQEHPMIQCFGLDVDTVSFATEKLAELVLNELQNNKTDSLVAIREDRFVQEMSRFNSNEVTKQEIVIRKDGVYVVIGGAGGLGLEISRYLTQKNPIKLIIINRSYMPEKSKWGSLINSNESESRDNEIYRKISIFSELETNGSEVHYYSGDVSDFNKMNQIFEDIYSKFGEVHGVIHCAAESGKTSRPIESQTFDGFKKVLLPKIQGTMVLDSILAEKDLDFFILYSSIASLWGGAGGGEYAAANSFIDSYSAYRNLQGKNTLSINWYAWEGLTDPGLMGYMSPLEALKAFEISLSYKMNQIVIGEFDSQMLEEWAPMMKIQFSPNVFQDFNAQSNIQLSAKGTQPMISSTVEVRLKGRKSESYSETEKLIAQIWAEVLGYEEINVNDNFFELGGDSLLVLKMLNLINERIDPEVEAADLFSYGSIEKLTNFIESKENIQSTKDPEDIDQNVSSESEASDRDLLNLIKGVKKESISIEEAMKGFEKI
ncbi:amino acid adenylation domain-containing protein [Bacillus cereus]|uniref:amino acid adenylation domain-containing protein n=1 Tax=Bacillus cereus TaxID=1396 RepID=UPI001E4E4742|nr:amino acid adenylation domain-containing protein [Bacillus cereus]MCU5475461.1 amino acid adenylation domain-containing protein [Bacillus cereus]MCU5614896.1 amino acid adenylation domain-containing protein [Bacillus cereus]